MNAFNMIRNTQIETQNHIIEQMSVEDLLKYVFPDGLHNIPEKRDKLLREKADREHDNDNQFGWAKFEYMRENLRGILIELDSSIGKRYLKKIIGVIDYFDQMAVQNAENRYLKHVISDLRHNLRLLQKERIEDKKKIIRLQDELNQRGL